MNIYSQISSNNTKTWILMAGFVAFFALIAWVMGEALGYGSGYVGVAVVLSLLTSVGSYFWGDQLILAMSGAREADRKRDFDLFTVTENLALAAGLPKPKLYVIDDTAMNAFATGRDPEHAIVVATTGILQRLDRRELEGVIAHELSHVKNYDIRLLLVVGVLVGTIAFVTDWFLRSLWWGGRRNREERSGGGAFMLIGIVLTILAPILATIIKLAISRQREYLADASGALITRYPEGLARALEKLAGDREVLEAATNATAHLYITNPFKDKNFGAWFAGLFDTHPPIEERIKRLRNM
ncbi:zinc metalloprotease HtpX [Candidatus Gottesmanbacteria bacterium RIFCSPHIGHO2_01_FULL_43_15]|nr:MAG: zinc metalloprotease HtpX [Candidatus Gottesmanbacteria bacterium RIFCSPHIGHO2_01_FULL_43_15]